MFTCLFRNMNNLFAVLFYVGIFSQPKMPPPGPRPPAGSGGGGGAVPSPAGAHPGGGEGGGGEEGGAEEDLEDDLNKEHELPTL